MECWAGRGAIPKYTKNYLHNKNKKKTMQFKKQDLSKKLAILINNKNKILPTAIFNHLFKIVLCSGPVEGPFKNWVY